MTRPPRMVRHKAQNSASEEVSINDDDSSDMAAYIADLSGELADLAGRAHLPMVAYFLNLARVEAGTHVQEKVRAPGGFSRNKRN